MRFSCKWFADFSFLKLPNPFPGHCLIQWCHLCIIALLWMCGETDCHPLLSTTPITNVTFVETTLFKFSIIYIYIIKRARSPQGKSGILLVLKSCKVLFFICASSLLCLFYCRILWYNASLMYVWLCACVRACMGVYVRMCVCVFSSELSKE